MNIGIIIAFNLGSLMLYLSYLKDGRKISKVQYTPIMKKHKNYGRINAPSTASNHLEYINTRKKIEMYKAIKESMMIPFLLGVITVVFLHIMTSSAFLFLLSSMLLFVHTGLLYGIQHNLLENEEKLLKLFYLD